jgi:ATP-dependent helicase HrpA
LASAHFENAVAEARRRLLGLVPQFLDRLGPILQLRQQARQRIGETTTPVLSGPKTLSSLSQLVPTAVAVRPGNPLADELTSLLPPRFLERVDYDRLNHLPRYLKALLLRAERAALNPAKSLERLRLLAPYRDALKALQAQPAKSAAAQRLIEDFRWLVEEFKVSLFAQELGTAAPVSPKRLDQQLEIVRNTP